MASSRTATAIQWSASSSKTINSATAVTSDAFAFNVEDWEADIYITADNQGTPASGDYVDFWWAYTPDATNYDSTEHAEYLGRLDTYSTNTPGEDPAAFTRPLRTASKGGKLIASAPQAATRNIVITAQVIAHRPQ